MAVTDQDRLYARRYARQHRIYERKIAPIFYDALRRSVQVAIQTLDPNDVDSGVWIKAYQDAYELAWPFARREYNHLKRVKADLPVAFFNEVWRQAMIAYGFRVNLAFSLDLTETTKQQIIKAIAEANELTLSRTQTARLIEKYTLGVIGRNRSLLIARTEATTASNQAKQIGAASYFEEIGEAKWYKMWITRLDGREREDHKVVDSKMVLNTDNFTVGGFQMEIPGDPTAPAKERVRCRCTTVNLSERQYQRRLRQ